MKRSRFHREYSRRRLDRRVDLPVDCRTDGGLLVVRGQMTTGDLVAFVMLLLTITASLSVLAQTGASVVEAVGERGVRLSGGQTQRVAIARALLAAPRLLLFDEATSALDAESEALVQDAIDALCVGRTSISVAHRLSTVVNADLIALVQGGRVIGSGTHDALLRDCAVYANLVRRQLRAADSSASLAS